MICKEYLERYLHFLTVNENVFTACQSAFAEIGAAYGIGNLTGIFQVDSTLYTVGGCHEECVFFRQDGERKEVPDYSREYTTGEKGHVRYELYRLLGQPPFTDEEKRDLDVVLDILFICCGRGRLINQVKKQSLTDSLTGLVNAGGFLVYVDELLEKGELTCYNAFYLNLERFGLVNKRFGVKETDTIIVRYANALKDFLVEGECAGRLGGDNFVTLIRKERTDQFVEFLEAVPVYGVLDGKQIPITIGAKAGGLIIDETVNTGNIINDCGMMLNVAKRSARKSVVFATDVIKNKLFKEKQVAFHFGQAIREKEFLVYYQPKVFLSDYGLAGAEALTRWKHQGNLISPNDFIPTYEQNGMICTLDFYVLEQVCRDIIKWEEKGLRPLRISVNFSRRHLFNPNLAEDILSVLKRYGVDKNRIEIELTETADEKEGDLLISFVKKMREYHVATSIDDFGTGYSSLNLLRSFPTDVLKIDKSFIDELSDVDKVVLSNVIRMASELNMTVVAEGVESRQQLEYLKSLQCGMAQGFIFDKPLPEDIFEERIRAWWYEMPE